MNGVPVDATAWYGEEIKDICNPPRAPQTRTSEKKIKLPRKWSVNVVLQQDAGSEGHLHVHLSGPRWSSESPEPRLLSASSPPPLAAPGSEKISSSHPSQSANMLVCAHSESHKCPLLLCPPSAHPSLLGPSFSSISLSAPSLSESSSAKTPPPVPGARGGIYRLFCC